MEAHSNLLPIELLIDKQCYHTAHCLASLPSTHPLAILFRIYKVDPSLIETIYPATRHPTHPSPLSITIADSKKLSLTTDTAAQLSFATHIYSDGSGADGKVGGAAVWVRNGQVYKSLKFHLGALTEYTIYESELIRIILALELIRKPSQAVPHPICISLDNQAAIKAPLSSCTNSGQYLTKALIRAALRLKK
jgi:hypothetical protein